MISYKCQFNLSPLEASHIKLNEPPLGENPKLIKDINCSSHYVCGEIATAANGLILLENVDELYPVSAIITDTTMDGSPHCKKIQDLLCGYGNEWACPYKVNFFLNV